MEIKTIQTPENLTMRISEIDPFPKLSTFPEGWNMDAILNPSPVKKARQPALAPLA